MAPCLKQRQKMSYLYILFTILFTVYGQIVIKWQVLNSGGLPNGTAERIQFLGCFLVNPWIISAFICAFLAAICWIMAMNRLALSHAYPFMSLSFVLVLLLSWAFFSTLR